MPTLNRFADILDLHKLTSSPMKIPMAAPITDSYTGKTDIVAPCLHHYHRQHQQRQQQQQQQQDGSFFSPSTLTRISTDSRHQKNVPDHHHHHSTTIPPQRLSSSSSSSSSTPTSSFMANGAPSLKSSQRRYHRVFALFTKHAPKDPSSTMARHVKKKPSLVGTASWNVFKKSSNRSPSQQPSILHTSSNHDSGGGGVFGSADTSLIPGACTCTGPTTLKMDRVNLSSDSTTTTTAAAASAAATTKQDYRRPSGGFRTLPRLMSGDIVRGGAYQQQKTKKLYDASQWPCVLVQDTIEQDRLVAQHYLLRMVFDGDHHAPVQSLLSQQQRHHPSLFGSSGIDGAAAAAATATTTTTTTTSAASSLHSGDNNSKAEPKGPVVLDVGCGLGQWTMEMATAYPKSTFIGIDLLPIFPKDIKPHNCHFFQANVKRLPLPFADNSIDFIYQRDLNWGLGQEDWYPLIKEYLRILKPGGWIELVEADLETKSSLKKECAMNDKLLEGFTKRRQDPYVARRLPTMLAVHGFRRVESHFQSLPLGWRKPHAMDDNTSTRQRHYQPTTMRDTYHCTPERQVQAMASQYLFYLRSLGPWLRLVMGLSQSKYIDYVDQLPLEWEQAQTYINWHCATAQKPYE